MNIKKHAFTIDYDTMVKAVATLGNALNFYEKNMQNPEKTPNLPSPQSLLLIFEDSCIQRFKYCSSMIWKYVRNFLKSQHKVIPKIATPNNVFHMAKETNLLTEKEAQTGITMIKCRKKIFDLYTQGMAQEIVNQIPEYYDLMQIILHKMKP